MIRIVCPHCHAPLSSAELEQATINGHLSLLCPECSVVLVSDCDGEAGSHTLGEHYPEDAQRDQIEDRYQRLHDRVVDVKQFAHSAPFVSGCIV